MEIKSELKTWKVYLHTNKANDKKYVGITSRDRVEQRWCEGRGYKSNPRFFSAIKKYGWDGFIHEVLFDGLTEAEAKSKESELISLLNTQDGSYGYNMTSGGEGSPGCHPSEETRRKLSASRMRENLSEETRKRKSEAMHNRRLSSGHKRKIGIGNSKPVSMFSIDGELIRSFASAYEAESETGVSHSHISQCCTNKRQTSGGYKWSFTQ